jgi:hypothetical protein
MADQKITALTEDTAPSLTDLLVTVKDPGGTPLSRKAQIGNVLSLLQGNIIYLTNNDGVSHYEGTVVIIDTTVDNGCKATTSSGDPKVIGIAAETVSASATGKYYQIGQATVLVQGNVARGDWLRASATSGRAESAGVLKPTSGGIGIALTAYAGGGAGTVTALISIDLSSTAALQQLATVTTNDSTTTAQTTAHTTDSGTDLLIVRIMTAGSILPTSVTFNSVTMTQIDSQAMGTAYVSAYYLRSPSVGTYNVVITCASSVSIQMIATNYAGSKSSPIRTSTKASGTSTTISVTPTSAVGDIVLDVIRTNSVAGWVTTAAGQTSEGSRGSYQYTSYRAGAAGTTAMSWSGSSAQYAVVAFAIAGS